MLVSMTGFGFGHYEDKSISIDVEIRSFNSRYFELQTRYFDLSGETEYKIRKFLKEKLKRGSVTLSIKIDSKNQFKINNKTAAAAIVMGVVLRFGVPEPQFWVDESVGGRLWQLVMWVPAGTVVYFVCLYVTGLKPHRLFQRQT